MKLIELKALLFLEQVLLGTAKESTKGATITRLVVRIEEKRVITT